MTLPEMSVVVEYFVGFAVVGHSVVVVVVAVAVVTQMLLLDSIVEQSAAIPEKLKF